MKSICVLKKKGYAAFKKRMDYILKLKEKDFANKMRSNKDYLIKFYKKNDLANLKKILTD